MRRRETWVELVKILACVVVVLENIVQFMAKSDFAGGSATVRWLDWALFYISAPLFFLCCGYLYQRGKPVKTYDEWKINVLKKLVTLGVPFVLFSCLNWALKLIFAADANNPAGDLLQILFVRPSIPYGYLYALFFIFLVTPTINNKKGAVALGILAVGVKWVAINWGATSIYAASTLMNYEIWFVLGMLMAFIDLPKLRAQKNMQFVGLILTVLFVAGSVAVYSRRLNSNMITFMFGLFGCSAAVVSIITVKFSHKTRKTIQMVADYTMPVFLMHTIFAAGLRSVLLKVGIASPVIHIAAGLLISFAGPVLVGVVLKKLGWAEFILYPGKFIKFGTKKEELKNGEKA